MERREFLAIGLGAAAWPFLPRARVRFGYAAITWGGNDRQAIADIAALGFRGIQLRQSAVTTWGDRPAELQELLAARKLTLVALSSGNMPRDPAGEEESLAQQVRHARFVRDEVGRYLPV